MMTPEDILKGIGCKGHLNVNKKKAIQAIQIALNLNEIQNRKMENKILYKDLIDIGFERINDHDDVFFDQNGYNYFRVEYVLNKSLYMEWDSETHELMFVRWREKDGTVLNKMSIDSVNAAKILIQFFSTNKYVSENESSPSVNYA